MQKNCGALGSMLGLLLSLAEAKAQTVPDITSIGQGTHLYLRCNATAWELNDKTRLLPSSSKFLWEIVYEVKEPWMVQGGDDCIITEAPEFNAWGSWQKNYGGQFTNLRIPESSRLRLQEKSDESANFKLVYPSLGRYRFVLNTRDGYFSVNKEAPAKAGEVTWTLPGNIVHDSFDRLFVSNYYPQNSLSLVDPLSGLPRWTYSSSEYFSFYSKCSNKDLSFITVNGRVAALSVLTGREIWHNDLNGTLRDNYGYLSCFPNTEQVYVSYGSEHTTLAGLKKTDGTLLWSWTAQGYAGILGTDSQHIFITSYQEGNTTLLALDKKNGQELWRTEEGSGYYSIADDGLLYLINGQTIRRIHGDTGHILWSYSGQASDSIWISFEQNRLLLHEKSRISLVDKNQGELIWSYDFSRYAKLYPYAQILRSGVILIRINDYSQAWSKQIALDSRTGHEIWQREDEQLSGYYTEDKQGGLWLIDGKTLSGIDARTGTTRWSFTLPSTNTGENIMSIMECDGESLFVSYGFIRSKYPPMGVLAFDVKSGRLKWQSWLETSLYLVGSDANRLILNAGYYGSTKALQK